MLRSGLDASPVEGSSTPCPFLLRSLWANPILRGLGPAAPAGDTQPRLCRCCWWRLRFGRGAGQFSLGGGSAPEGGQQGPERSRNAGCWPGRDRRGSGASLAAAEPRPRRAGEPEGWRNSGREDADVPPLFCT